MQLAADKGQKMLIAERQQIVDIGRALEPKSPASKHLRLAIASYFNRILGARTADALNYHLQNYQLDISNVFDYPEKAEAALYDMYGDGARIILHKIILLAFKEFGIECHDKGHLYTDLREALCRIRVSKLEGLPEA